MAGISTAAAYGSVLTSLMSAQTSESQTGAQISTGKVATDLKGYGANAETLTAMQAANTQVTGYLNQSNQVAAQLSVQNLALQQVAGAGQGAREAIANVLAAGDGSTLMESLQSYFQTAVTGLNTTYNGQYLFSGGQPTTKPVTATNITDLTSAPSVSSLFQNGQTQTTTQLDANTSLNTGFTASQLGEPLFNALQNIEAYNQGPNGPFSGTLTAAQSSFLQSQLAAFGTVNTNLTEAAAENGVMQSQVSDAQTSLTNQQTMLTGMIGNITDSNLAQASTDLQQAQLSIQATGEVLLALKSSSLLNLLSPTGVA
jgi:flagellar hook-associated protein 3 FlgL